MSRIMDILIEKQVPGIYQAICRDLRHDLKYVQHNASTGPGIDDTLNEEL